MAREIEEIILKVSVDDKQLKKLDSSLDKTQDELKKTEKQANLLGDALNLIGVSVVLNGLKELGSAAIDMANQFERVENVLLSTFKTQEDVARQMQFITSVSNRLGVSIIASAEGYAKLAASAKLVGISTEDTQAVFEATATAASALALSGEDVNGVLRAFSQIASKGKVQAEELLQINERGIPVQALLAKSLGVTNEELQDMAQKGEILAGDALPALAREIKATFHEGALNNANSEIAKATRRQNEFNESLRTGGIELRKVTSAAGELAVKGWLALQDVLSDSIAGYMLVADSVGIYDVAAKEANDTNKDLANSFKEVTKETDTTTAEMRKTIAIFKEAGIAVDNAFASEKIRKELGLSQKGFKKISSSVMEAVKAGGDFNQIIDESTKLLDKLGNTFDSDDFIKSKDVENAEKINDLLGDLIGDSFTDSLIAAGVDIANLGKTGSAQSRLNQANIRNESSQTALESGSAEAAKFLIRPIDNQTKVQDEQLETQKRIEQNTAKTANQTPVFLKGRSL